MAADGFMFEALPGVIVGGGGSSPAAAPASGSRFLDLLPGQVFRQIDAGLLFPGQTFLRLGDIPAPGPGCRECGRRVFNAANAGGALVHFCTHGTTSAERFEVCGELFRLAGGAGP